MKCGYCGKTNQPELLLCEHCGRPIAALTELSQYRTLEMSAVRSKTGPLNYARSGTGYLHNTSFVTLDLVESNRKIYLKTEGHIVLGREDLEADWKPNVDLTPYGAAEKGVSRSHVDLFFESDQVFVLELGSANGTRLNGVAVQTGSAHQVHNGDLLELGRFPIRIYFD
jgi:hypothetical protein